MIENEFDYPRAVEDYRHFFVRMSGKQAISESDVEEAMRFWVQPLLTSASEVFLYRRRSWVPDIPSRLKAVILGKTKAISKLDFRQMELHTHWSFWSWALKSDWHLLFVVGERHLAASDIAKHAWHSVKAKSGWARHKDFE